MNPAWVSAVAESAAAGATTAAVIVALAQSAKAWRISLRVRPYLGQGHSSGKMFNQEIHITFPALLVHVVNDAMRTATVCRITAASYPFIKWLPAGWGYMLARRKGTLAGPGSLWPTEPSASLSVEPGKDHTFVIRLERLQESGVVVPKPATDCGTTSFLVSVEEASGRVFRGILRLAPHALDEAPDAAQTSPSSPSESPLPQQPATGLSPLVAVALGPHGRSAHIML